MKRRAWFILPLVAALAPAESASGKITIEFDTTYDGGFFTTYPQAMSVLEYAAETLTRFGDDLDAIPAATGINTWTANVRRPDTGAQIELVDMVVPADTIIVFAGGRHLSSLGLGGPGGSSVSGTGAWVDTVLYRGEAGAELTNPTDFALWGGAVTFDTDPPKPWYFGIDPAGLNLGHYDFLSIALHELGHLLGFGAIGFGDTRFSWQTHLSGNTFTGPASVAEYGALVPLDGPRVHWADNTLGNVNGVPQTAAMTPSIFNGERQLFTDLDFAGLDDLGWDLLPPTLTWTAATDDHWETYANWSAAPAPGPTATVVFDAAGPHQPRLYRNESVAGIEFRTAGWAVHSSHTLTLGPVGITSAGAGENTIDPSVTMAADSTWTVGAANRLTVNGNLNGAGHALTKDGPGTLGLGEALDLGGVTIGGGVIELAGGATSVLVTEALAIGPTAALDPTDGDLIVDYTGGASPFAAVAGYVASGYDGGSWQGAGIRSSAAAGHPQHLTAIGIIDNSDTELGIGGLAAFAGRPVSLEAVLVGYCWYGDANLDGIVDSNDYDRIDTNWILWTQEGRLPEGGFRWAVGDFNYDGTIDSNDYDKIDNAWLLSGGAPVGAGTPVPTPEPASAALLLMGVALLARRPRRLRRR